MGKVGKSADRYGCNLGGVSESYDRLQTGELFNDIVRLQQMLESQIPQTLLDTAGHVAGLRNNWLT